MQVYADNAATTKMSKTAIAAMTAYFETTFGNPSSLHSVGQEAKEALENGHLVVSVQHPGYWTRGGHYIVCESINEEGKVQVRDSNIYNYIFYHL